MNKIVYYALDNNQYSFNTDRFDIGVVGIYQPRHNALLKYRFKNALENDKEGHERFKLLVEKLNT